MNADRSQVMTSLPVYPTIERTRWTSLRVDGAVYYPVTLSLDELEMLPKHTLTQDFHCEEGWTVPDQRWDGARVADLVELSEPTSDARYVAFSAGNFTVCLTLEEALSSGALLALRLNGKPVPDDHGGPCRLIVSGKTCYYNIKWADRIRLLAERPDETGKTLALERIQAGA